VRDPTAKPRIRLEGEEVVLVQPARDGARPALSLASERFIDERLAGVRDERVDSKRYNEAYLHALIELVRSDIPLDPDTRRLLADELECLYFPKTLKRVGRQGQAFAFVYAVDSLKACLRHWNKSHKVIDIETFIAERMFHIEVDTLRKRYQGAPTHCKFLSSPPPRSK
jgi:hypothetical protein